MLASGVVRVTDTLPSGIVITSAIAPSGWSCGLSGQTVTCDSTIALPVAETTNLGAITGTVRISNTACSGPIVNTATIAGFQAPYTDSQTTNNTATASTTLDCNAALTATKSNGVSTVTSGTTTPYTIEFTNTGPSSADGATVTDQPGVGLSGCNVTSCTASGGSPVSATCPATPANLLAPGGTPIPSLPAGGSVAIAVQCLVSASGT